MVATRWYVRLLSGFSYLREVRFDTRLEVAFFRERTFWFFRSARTVRFREVDHVAYSFKGLATSWDILGRSHDSVESFSISLALKESGEVLFVTRFIGEGFAGDFGTWLMGDALVDLAGTQEEDSRVFVTNLCKVLGVNLGPKVEAAPDADGLKWSCSGCGRMVAPKPKCLYCGGKAAPVEAEE